MVAAESSSVSNAAPHGSSANHAYCSHFHVQNSIRTRLADLFEQFAVSGFVESENDSFSADDDRAFDQIGILRHEANCVRPRRRLRRHVSLSIQFIARIQKRLVVPRAN